MNISTNSKSLLVNELKYVAQKMKGAELPSQKLYFYSAAYGITNRLFNIEFDPTLVFIFFTLEASYNTMNVMVQRVQRGEEQAIKIPAEIFENLTDSIEELASKIDRNEDVSDTLQRISNITYATTGNGYYLSQKGLLKVSPGRTKKVRGKLKPSRPKPILPTEIT